MCSKQSSLALMCLAILEPGRGHMRSEGRPGDALGEDVRDVLGAWHTGDLEMAFAHPLLDPKVPSLDVAHLAKTPALDMTARSAAVRADLQRKLETPIGQKALEPETFLGRLDQGVVLGLA